LLGTTVLAGVGLVLAAAPAVAQDVGEVVTVTGYRASLADSTNAKRASVSFSESVFAEDIGKFPDTNLAESLNRIPGITITRETDGEGVNVSIRGLGTNFTKILLNGSAIAVATTGATDSVNNNREVDLDNFPSELFTNLTVSKSPRAEQLEGGAAGTITMKSRRPFDNPGLHVTYSAQGSRASLSDEFGYRGSLIVSDTEGPFGILVGVSGVQNNTFIKGWEDGNAGWVGPSTTTSGGVIQCTTSPSSNCNSLGSRSWGVLQSIQPTVPGGTVPATLIPTPTAIAGNPFNANCTTPYVSGGNNYLPVGCSIDQSMLLALNPGMTINQLGNALLPRLGRDMFQSGSRDRFNAVVSAEFRPTDNLHFYFDFIFGRKFNDINRSDMNWGVRAGAGSQSFVPANLKTASDWAAMIGTPGGAVTSGTFYDTGFVLEARPYKEKGDFYSFNPGMSWQVTDLLHIDLQANATRSHFLRDSPTVFVTTAFNNIPYGGFNGVGNIPGSVADTNAIKALYPIPNATPPAGGAIATFTNGFPFPHVASTIDYNNPNNFEWYNGRVNLQDEKRYTQTEGMHLDVAYGGDEFQVKVGAAYDHAFRNITAIDASAEWSNQICGDAPNVYVPGIATPCLGLNIAGARLDPAGTHDTSWQGNLSDTFGRYGFPLFLGYGLTDMSATPKGYTAGWAPMTYAGSMVPTSALHTYLKPGPTGFITVDYNAIFAASNYYQIDRYAQAHTCHYITCVAYTAGPLGSFATGSNTGGTSGSFDERNWGGYVQFDGQFHIGGRTLKYDAGLRWVETHQTIYSPTQVTDPHNYWTIDCSLPQYAAVKPTSCTTGQTTMMAPQGAAYPNYYVFSGAKAVYQAFLPSFTAVYEIADDFQIRASLSRTMSRPNPGQMISVVNFSDPTAQQASLGNPSLKPYYANNIDLGAELYTGGEGYFSVTAFRKSLSGFTGNSTITEPFSYLSGFGVTYASLAQTQKDAMKTRSGGGCVDDATCASLPITITQQVNGPGLQIMNGLEFQLVQPLDFLLEQYGLKGFGFQGNMTIIDAKTTFSGSRNLPATGVAPLQYNLTGYYEDNGVMLRVMYNWNDKVYASGSNQQSVCLPIGTSSGGCTAGAFLFGAPYGQMDFSSSLKLSTLFGDLPSDPEVTFDVQNVTSSKQRSYFQLPDAVHNYYIKGQTFLFGVRGTF
jgi:TonB-dependent receptor